MTAYVHCDVPEPHQPKYLLELAKLSFLTQFFCDIIDIPVSHFQSSISG